jgi:hypothetical protein
VSRWRKEKGRRQDAADQPKPLPATISPRALSPEPGKPAGRGQSTCRVAEGQALTSAA